MQESAKTLPAIRHTVLLKAPIEKVWQAVSTGEAWAQWFMPPIGFEAKKGHAFTFQNQFGTSHCRITELEPPHLLAFSWNEEWHVTFELKELEGQTEFTVTHAGWVAGKAAPTGETMDVIRDRMDQGWGTIVNEGLRRLVEG